MEHNYTKSQKYIQINIYNHGPTNNIALHLAIQLFIPIILSMKQNINDIIINKLHQISCNDKIYIHIQSRSKLYIINILHLFIVRIFCKYEIVCFGNLSFVTMLFYPAHIGTSFRSMGSTNQIRSLLSATSRLNDSGGVIIYIGKCPHFVLLSVWNDIFGCRFK